MADFRPLGFLTANFTRPDLRQRATGVLDSRLPTTGVLRADFESPDFRQQASHDRGP
jgi:hypothetical protein